jgi:GT2 family glycosyltransferase
MPELSVVIPTVGRPGKLDRVLGSLERQTVSRERFEVVVVGDPDEPRPDEVERVIAAHRHGTRHLLRDGHSVATARNLGWREARAPIVLFLDDDVLPGPDLVAEHLSVHRAQPDETVGVLGRVTWARELRVTPFMRWLETGIQFDFDSITGEEAGWGRFYTANASLKRSLIARVGGFDEERLPPFGYEDVDLGYRLSRIGFRLLYNPRAGAEHLHAMDLDSWRRKIGLVAVAERQFCLIHPEIPPYFRRLFSEAVDVPPARGRGTRLARFVPRWTPWLGARVWTAADLYWRQQLAPHFLAAWDELDAGEVVADARHRPPHLAVVPSPSDPLRASSGGSDPSGPK